MSLRLSDQQSRQLLGIIFVLAMIYQAGYSAASLGHLLHGTTQANYPLLFGFRLQQISGITPEATAAGVHLGDVLETVDGKPFTGELVLDEDVLPKHAGDTIRVTVRRPNGTRLNTSIRLAPIRAHAPSISSWILSIMIEFVLPYFCLALGFWVAFARPFDRLAWLLLALMLGFSECMQGLSWNWPWIGAAIAWKAIVGHPYGVWLIWIALFGLWFPEPPAWDRKRPWIKWLLFGPLIGQAVLFLVSEFGSDYDFAAVYPLKPVYAFYLRFSIHTLLAMAAVSFFFAMIWWKSAVAQSADAKRRLRILYFGTAISLLPLLITAVIGLINGNDIFFGVPQWLIVTALSFLLLFPVTLAYVIVVQRAMKVSMVVRQGVKYALARRTLQVTRAVFLTIAITTMVNAFNSHSGTTEKVVATAILIWVISLRKNTYDKLSTWIDRKFFREAYSAEIVMSELGEETRQFTEAEPLLATVARRIADTLHTSTLAVFVKQEERFCVSQALGLEAPVSCLSPQGRSIGLLEAAKKPELVYFDDPRSWVHGAAPDEQQKLRRLHTEVLVALPGRKELLGVLALGPKRSEQPYSPSDLRLLQSVAVQTGLALENTQLLDAFAKEAGQRERLNREMEIAREVQERLFPQSCPAAANLDYFGLCRPALAVGGDYYDYIPRGNGKLGIALGDVSGKGISAALMMASLQSLLRGQLEAGVDDLSVLLTNTNRLIFDVSTSNRYVTFFYGEFDPATRKLNYVNAGHNPPIILRGDEVIRLEACGPVVGLIRGIQYECAEFQFVPGDVLILFTDGISEAMTVKDEEWGDDRLIEAARACRTRCAAQMTEAILAAADRFTAGEPQHDDMTLIACKVS